MAFNPVTAGEVRPEDMIPPKPALKLENITPFFQAPPVRPVTPPQVNPAPCPFPAAPIDHDTPPIPPSTNFAQATKAQAVGGFAGELVSQVLAMNRPPLVPAPKPNEEVVAAQKKLDDIVAELRRLGAPVGPIAPSSASVSSGPVPSSALSAALEADLHMLTQQLHALLTNGASFAIPHPAAGAPYSAPGSAMSSIAPTIYASTPVATRPSSPMGASSSSSGTALPPLNNIYQALQLDPDRFAQGNYNSSELDQLIQNAAATGLPILKSKAAVAEKRKRLKTFIDNFHNNPRFAPLTVVRINTGPPATPIQVAPIAFPNLNTPGSAPSSPAGPRRLTQPPTGPSGSGLPSGLPSGSKGQWLPINHHHYINWPKLEGQELFSISRKAGDGKHVKINKFPNRKVSPALKEALVELLKTQRLPDFSDLPTDEREFLYNLLALTEPTALVEATSSRQKEKIAAIKAALKKYNAEQQLFYRLRRQQDRLNLLVGEAMAGNKHNPKLIKEATTIINSFVRHGVITLAQAQELQKHIL